MSHYIEVDWSEYETIGCRACGRVPLWIHFHREDNAYLIQCSQCKVFILEVNDVLNIPVPTLKEVDEKDVDRGPEDLLD